MGITYSTSHRLGFPNGRHIHMCPTNEPIILVAGPLALQRSNPPRETWDPAERKKGGKSSTSKSDFCMGTYIASFPGGFISLRWREQNNHKFHWLVRKKHPISINIMRYCPAHNPASDCGFLLEFGMHLFRSL